MTTIKNIIFDFGGVLVDWDPRYFYRDYFKNDEEMEYFLGNICTLEWNSQFDKGVPFDKGIAELVQEHPEYKEAIEAYKTGWSAMLTEAFPESVALLRELKAEGYKVYGLTNWSAETIGVAFKRFDFFKEFDGIVVSGEEKLLKPDERLYQVLLNRFELKAEECVFMDDNLKNVEVATRLGIQGIHFDNLSHVREQLSELLSKTI